MDVRKFQDGIVSFSSFITIRFLLLFLSIYAFAAFFGIESTIDELNKLISRFENQIDLIRENPVAKDSKVIEALPYITIFFFISIMELHYRAVYKIAEYIPPNINLVLSPTSTAPYPARGIIYDIFRKVGYDWQSFSKVMQSVQSMTMSKLEGRSLNHNDKIDLIHAIKFFIFYLIILRIAFGPAYIFGINSIYIIFFLAMINIIATFSYTNDARNEYFNYYIESINEDEIRDIISNLENKNTDEMHARISLDKFYSMIRKDNGFVRFDVNIPLLGSGQMFFLHTKDFIKRIRERNIFS